MPVNVIPSARSLLVGRRVIPAVLFALSLYLPASPARATQQVTDDQGADWALMGPDETITSVATSPSYQADGTIFIAGAKRALASTDQGSTWHDMTGDIRSKPGTPTTADHNWVVGVSSDYAADRTVVLAGFDGAFLSRDGGATWEEMRQGLPVCPTCPRFSDVVFSPNFAKDHTFALVSDGARGAFITRDGGQTFKSLVASQLGPATSIAFSPGFASDHTVWAGTPTNLLKSTDAGASWARVQVEVDPPVTNDEDPSFSYHPAVSPDGAVLIVGAFNGITRSTDGGQTWEHLDRGPCLSGTATAFHPLFSGNQVVYSVAAGCGVFFSNDAGETWSELMGVDFGNYLFPAPLISHAQLAWLPGDPYILLIPTRHGLRAHAAVPDRD